MSEILEFAKTTARRAGELVRSRVGARQNVEHKGAIDLVTDTDRAAEELIVRAIVDRFPEHTIVAEERKDRKKSPIHSWYIDPIDGTTNFSHGYPVFCVSIAYEEKHKLVLGVVYDPMRDEMFYAARGRGAYLDDGKIAVSTTDDLDKSLLSTGFPYNVRKEPDRVVREFTAFLLSAQAVRRDGAAALDMCYLACGRFDGFWERDLSPWDTAAGQVIVEEAGGIITDFRGKPFRAGGKTILATNGLIHMQMMETLQNA